MIYSTLREQNRSFCFQVNGNIMLSKFFLWNEAVEVIEATEVIEAVEVNEAAEVPDRDGTRNSSSLDPRGPGPFFTPRFPEE